MYDLQPPDKQGKVRAQDTSVKKNKADKANQHDIQFVLWKKNKPGKATSTCYLLGKRKAM